MLKNHCTTEPQKVAINNALTVEAASLVICFLFRINMLLTQLYLHLYPLPKSDFKQNF